METLEMERDIYTEFAEKENYGNAIRVLFVFRVGRDPIAHLSRRS